MKILGLVNNDTYLVQVSHTEIEKVFNKYYNNLDKLKVGDELDLGAGYGFREDIKHACNEMRNAMKAFEANRMTLMRFANMVAELPDEQEGGAA